MEIIHENTLSYMDEMSRRFFWMNKKIDRMKSILNTKFCMPIFANLIHQELAHSYPILADDINDIQEQFNYDANYFSVEGATEDYSSVVEIAQKIYEYTIETNQQLNNLIKVSIDEGDYNVYHLLIPISRNYSRYVANAILILDKAKQYNGNNHAMDKDSREWWVL